MNRIALIDRQPGPVPDAGQDGGAYRYWAFLSYSHADSKAADRLHRWLERFRTPATLAGKPHPLGTIPDKLVPIFRDRHELAAASSLGGEIQEALQASRYLIVLCSPAAARSRWVDEEIRRFKRLHGEDRVLAAIVDGEPFTDGADECLPAALRHRVGKDGKLTRRKVEPIAADLRDDRDGWRTGALKVAAGMLDVGLDDLIQRDQLRRQRKMTLIAAASILGMAFTTGLSVVAINARDAARDERREAEGLVGFLLGDLRGELEPIGRLDALDKVGARALAYYERQDKAELTDDQLAQRSKALTLLGQIATTRGDTDGALARYREALRSTAELVERAPGDPERLFDHAQNVFYVGEIARGRGQLDQAGAAYRTYQSLARRMVEADPTNPKWQMEALYARENIGIVLYLKRQYRDAATEFAAAVPAMRRLVANDPSNRDYESELSNILAWLGDARRDEGRLDLAIAAREAQIARLTRKIGASAQRDVQLVEHLQVAQQALALVQWDIGDTGRAVATYREALANTRSLLAVEPDNAVWQAGAATIQLALVEPLVTLGRRTEADQLNAAGCAAAQALRRRDPTAARARSLDTTCRMNGAIIALAAGRPVEAIESARQAVVAAGDERNSDAVRNRYVLARAFRLLGDAQRLGGDRAAAEAAWTAGLAAIPTVATERPREMADRLVLLERLGRRSEARSLAERLRDTGFGRKMT